MSAGEFGIESLVCATPRDVTGTSRKHQIKENDVIAAPWPFNSIEGKSGSPLLFSNFFCLRLTSIKSRRNVFDA